MIIKDLLYIFQIENYQSKRFLAFTYSHWKWWNLEQRKKLVWTAKAKLIFFSVWFFVLIIVLGSLLSLGWKAVFIIPFLLSSLPLLVILSNFLIWPIDNFLKKRIITGAKDILKKNKKNIKVIGITGSYGKTSTKEILAKILAEKFRIIKTEENINTDIGVANFIIQNPKLFEQEAVFIVEMGAYQRGDIKKICEIVDPDYSILTGINESHLERFGSLENIIQAKFELPQHTKSECVLNIDDKNVLNNYTHFSIPKCLVVSKDAVKNIKVLDDFHGLEFEWDGFMFRTKLLAEHNISSILATMVIAQTLGMSLQEIEGGVKKIDYVPHRLELMHNPNTNVWVIDDSYNGNINGIISGVEVLKRASGRKIILTPGLVELGEKTKEIHHQIGNLYASSGIDLILLIKSIGSVYIREALEKNNFKNYTIYSNAQAAHDDLAQVLKNDDTILFQNDLADNYF